MILKSLSVFLLNHECLNVYGSHAMPLRLRGHLNVRVLLLQELPALVQGRGDIDEKRPLEGCAGLIVDGVVAGLGRV